MKIHRAFLLKAAILAVCFLAARHVYPQEGVFFIDIESAQENLIMLQDDAGDLEMRVSVLEAENDSLNSDITERKIQAGKMEKLYNQIVEKRKALEEISIYIQDLALKKEVDEALNQNRETEGNLLVNLNDLRLEIKELEKKLSENISIINVLEKRLAVNNTSISNLQEAIERSQSQSEVLKNFLEELSRLEQEIAPYIDEKIVEPQNVLPDAVNEEQPADEAAAAEPESVPADSSAPPADAEPAPAEFEEPADEAVTAVPEAGPEHPGEAPPAPLTE